MPIYTHFGTVFDSEIELPELPVTIGIPEVSIRRGSVPRVEHRATAEEEYVFNEECGAFRIRFGREILVDQRSGIAPASMRVMLLGRVMAFLLRQRGWLPLHSSGVKISGRIVLFLGCAGAGKSTAAAAFHSRGHAVITDDVAPVRRADAMCVVQPGLSRLRLFESSRPALGRRNLNGEFQLDKHSYDLAAGQFPETRVQPLNRIYVLETSAGPSRVQVLPPVASAALLFRHTFLKHRRSLMDVLDGNLRKCVEVAEIVPVLRLARTRSIENISDMVRAVEADLESGRR